MAQVARARVVEQIEKIQQQVDEHDRSDERDLSPGLCRAFTDLARLVRTMEFSPDAYELVMAVDRFVAAADGWLQQENLDRVKLDGRTTAPSGSDEMWRYWAEVKAALPERARRLPTPAILLWDQKVSPAVICAKYGFRRPDGKPDIEKLNEHLMAERKGEPSPHFDPATYVHGADRQRMEYLAEQWAGRPERLAKLGVILGQEKPSGPRVPPPPIEDLAGQPGVTLEFIARKHRLSEDEVRHYLAERGIVLDRAGTRFYDPSIADINRQRQQQSSERERWSGTETYEQMGDDLAGRAQAMHHHDGLKPADIARALSAARTREGKSAVTYQQVKKLLTKEAAAT